MRNLIVSEFMSLDGVMQAPGGKDEDRDGGFEHGGWTMPYWHDEIGARFVEMWCAAPRSPNLRDSCGGVRANAFGRSLRRRQEIRRLEDAREPIWRNTTIIRDNVMDSVRALKMESGKNIFTDGSSQLVHTSQVPAPLTSC
jgi:hypothetical protein